MISSYRSERQFGSAVAALFLIAALWPLLGGEALAWPWLVAAAVLLLLGWRNPRGLRPALRAWSTLGHWLGVINTHTLLAVAFFFVITPLALLFRLAGRDALRLKLRPAPSYWIEGEKRWDADSFKKQF